MHQKPSGGRGSFSAPPEPLAVIGGWGPQEGRGREGMGWEGRERKGGNWKGWNGNGGERGRKGREGEEKGWEEKGRGELRKGRKSSSPNVKLAVDATVHS